MYLYHLMESVQLFIVKLCWKFTVGQYNYQLLSFAQAPVLGVWLPLKNHARQDLGLQHVGHSVWLVGWLVWLVGCQVGVLGVVFSSSESWCGWWAGWCGKIYKILCGWWAVWCGWWAGGARLGLLSATCHAHLIRDFPSREPLLNIHILPR